MILSEAQDLHHAYVIGKKSIPVLHGACMQVQEGETVAVVGVSGAGKSTLLHILGGLDRPDAGSVRLRGEDLYGASGGRRTRIRSRHIGFVFQSYHLLPEMDVLGNVMLPALGGADPHGGMAAMRRHAMELLESVGLAERFNHTPMDLSGGERQRAALARALMNEPDLVLADEPTGNLDDATGGRVLELLFSLTKARGHALVLVTHNERIAASCDKVLRLKQGILE